jgi:predicted nucleic acid-binding protein
VNCTFDSNVLVYVIVKPPDPRGERARDLLSRSRSGEGAVLLLQTLGEFAHVAMRKFGIAAEEIRSRVTSWQRMMPMHAAGVEDLDLALRFVSDNRMGFWDAYLCATANRAGVQYLLSEDMPDGRRLGSLRIVNPFRPENTALIDRILPP